MRNSQCWGLCLTNLQSVGFVPHCRTTGSMCFCDSSGMTLVWHIRSTQMTLWTWTPPCWTPFGNLTCSLQMRREPTFTRLQQTTNCFGYSRMEMSFTASGDLFSFFLFFQKEPNLLYENAMLSDIAHSVPCVSSC